MPKKQQETIREWDVLLSAGEFLTREYQDNYRFIRVDYWREPDGYYGLWLYVSELIDDIPETFMGFDLEQKVIDDG